MQVPGSISSLSYPIPRPLPSPLLRLFTSLRGRTGLFKQEKGVRSHAEALQGRFGRNNNSCLSKDGGLNCPLSIVLPAADYVSIIQYTDKMFL